MLDLMVHCSPQIDQLKLDATGSDKTMSTHGDGSGKIFTAIVFGDQKRSRSDALCHSLVLHLFASDILEPALDEKRLYAKLAIDATRTPVINHDHMFEGFNLT
mmetsp:Transcript_20661/g.26660  ORF Transcript_20661/g.26660 Transcript_20661/m.26660 type:complete len:103 (-) Transcript_20661:38-346(-)